MGDEHPINHRTGHAHEPALNKLFRAAFKIRACALHLKVGQALQLRIYGELKMRLKGINTISSGIL